MRPWEGGGRSCLGLTRRDASAAVPVKVIASSHVVRPSAQGGGLAVEGRPAAAAPRPEALQSRGSGRGKRRSVTTDGSEPDSVSVLGYARAGKEISGEKKITFW